MPRFKRPRHPRALAAVAAIAVAALAGCSDDPATPGARVSEEGHAAALDRAAQALQADRALATVQTVDQLTSGFAEGLAGESAGLATELGSALQADAQAATALSLGARLAASRVDAGAATAHLAELQRAQRLANVVASDPQPGDLLARWTRPNLDGSITELSVYQDAPASVVRIELVTDWPNTHLLLRRAQERVLLDRGADWIGGADDLWLSYAGELTFAEGQRLRREIDERASGGLQDGDRVSVLSSFFPRPGHPRLVDITSTLVVDVHELQLPGDDRFVRADRVTRFAGTAHDTGSPRVIEALVLEQPVAEGQTPCGGDAARTIHFEASSVLVRLHDQAQWSCAGGGLLAREVRYSDGTDASLTLRELTDGVYTVEAFERDGAHTTGSFDEGTGEFQVETVGAAGSDPRRRAIEGRVLPNDTGWELDETITFADSFVERNHLELAIDAQGKQLSGSHQGRDGAWTLQLQVNSDETRSSGRIENSLGDFLQFDAELLADGGRIVDFTAHDAVRTIEGHLEVDAHGCGTGTLIVTEGANRAQIEVTFCDGTLVES